MNWYLSVLQKYAVFSGRARRKEYWYFMLFNIIVTIILAFGDGLLGTFDPETGVGFLGLIYALGVLLPGIGVTIRRLHDTNRSGWWLLLILLPIIGPIVLLIFTILGSDPEENQYGPNPVTD